MVVHVAQAACVSSVRVLDNHLIASSTATVTLRLISMAMRLLLGARQCMCSGCSPVVLKRFYHRPRGHAAVSPHHVQKTKPVKAGGLTFDL